MKRCLNLPSKRIVYPTVSPNLQFISSETRFATDVAATLQFNKAM